MKICLCIGRLSYGGAERQIIYISSFLASEGYDVTLLVLKDGDAYLENLSGNVKVIKLGLVGYFSSMITLRAKLIELSPDIVVGFLFHASLLLRSVSPMLNCPVVSVHRNVSCGSFQRDVLMKLTSVFDTLTVSNTRLARRRLHSRLARSELVVVPNIYFELGRPAERAVGQGSEGLVWGYVGRLEAQKNLPLLLQAFGQHLKSFPAAKLHIVGDGPEKPALLGLCEQFGISDRVVFLGHTQEVQAELARMDAFIMTSLREGMPNALIEAMAARLPVVATAVGEVSTMIDSGQTGILCEDFSVETISTAMNRVAQLPHVERLAMGEAARAYVVSTCSPEAVIDQWESVLKRAAGCQ